jgi:hypothetical protein
VAEQEERAAEDERRPPLAPADRVAVPVPEHHPSEEERPGDEVAQRHGEKRRQVPHDHSDGQERRPPDDVDRPQRDPDFGAHPSSF